MLQCRFRSSGVRKGDVPEGNRTVAGKRYGIRRLFLGRLLLQDFFHTPCGSHGPYRGIEYVGNHTQRKKNLGHIVYRCHQTADLPAVLMAGEPQEHDDSGIDGEIDQRGKDSRNPHGTDAGPGKFLRRSPEFLPFLLLGTESLYYPDGGKEFPAHLIQAVQLLLQPSEPGITQRHVCRYEKKG